MTVQQVKNLVLASRQIRDAVKHSLDNVTDIAEQALESFLCAEQKSHHIQAISIDRNNLLNKKELARRLGVSVRTISNLQTEGLPIVSLGKKRVQFDYEEVLAWAKEREVKGSRKTKLRVV